MTLFFLLLAAYFGVSLWLTFRVARSSVPLAVATFLFGPLGAIYTLVTERDHPDTRVTVPFVASVVLGVAFIASAWQLMSEAQAEEAAALAAEAAASAEADVSAVPEVVNLVMDDGLPKDPLERFSYQLTQSGLKHQLTPLGADAKLPGGAMLAAELAIDAPSGGGVLSGRVLRCRDGRACKQLAGTYKLSGKKGEPRPQVTQNGMVLLVMQPKPELEGLHHVVQGVFRRTRFAGTT